MIRALLSAAVLALLVPQPAAARWYEASSQHFILTTDQDPAAVRAFTERLERFDRAIHVLRNVPDRPFGKSARVHVYVLRKLGEVQDLFGRGGMSIAGWYEPRVGGPVAFVPNDDGGNRDLSGQAILFHEYSHHFMFMNWPNLVFPAWYVEGFAEFHATASIDPDGSVTFGRVPAYRTDGIGWTSVLSASAMLKPDASKLRGAEVYMMYARGWLLTHYLTFDPARQGQLVKYIAALNGNDAANAAAVFGNPNWLDNDMNSYMRRPTIQVSTVPAAKLSVGPIDVRPLGAGEVAALPVVMRSARGVSKSTAPGVAAAARKIAADFPTDPAVLNALAEAEYDAGNYDASAQAADRAIAADAQSVHALTYRGRAQMAQLRVSKNSDPDKWAAARHWFVRANKVDPTSPLPLYLYYLSFGEAGEEPTDNAGDAVISSCAYAPFGAELKISAALVFLRGGDVALARTALLPVAYSPHQSKAVAAASKAIDAIDAKDIKTAIGILQGLENEAYRLPSEDPPKS